MFIHRCEFLLKYFAKNMIYLRKREAKKWPQTLADIGFKRTTWSNYETGLSKPSLLDFYNIAKHFDISESDLLNKDLEATGKLIEKGNDAKNEKNSKLIGKGIGNLTPKKYGIPNILSLIKEGSDQLQRMPKVITIDTQGHENVVMVPVKARAGYLNGYADPKYMETLPAYRLPGLNTGTYRLFEVEGASMYPTFHGGDLVIGSYVDQLRDVRDDRVYVVVTKNDGIVVKRVLNRIEKDGKLILKSDNYKDRDMYPPIVCDPGDIVEMWYSTGFISRQMRPPAEVYNRLIDLEGRLSLLEEEKRKKSK